MSTRFLTEEDLKLINKALAVLEKKIAEFKPEIDDSEFAGGYYIPAVDSDGDLTWTPSEEGMPAVAGVNIRGPKGERGLAGVSATHKWSGTSLTISSAAGSSTRDLQGPKGDKGEPGDPGEAGPAGKNAYQYALDNGFTGTEKEFADGLMQEAPTKEEFDKLSEDVADIKQNGTGTGNGATTAQANSLWTIIQKSAFAQQLTDAEINEFKTAWGIGGEVEPDIPDEPIEPDNPEVTLTSISATYTGGEVAVGTELTSLTGITVTATYSDGNTANVTGYILSGTIVEGSNTITVSYGGKTTTFTVTGVAEVEDTRTLLYNWDFTGSEPLVDKVSGKTATIYKGTPTMNQSGLNFTSETDCILLHDNITDLSNCDIELEFGTFENVSTSKHLRLLTFTEAYSTGFICRNTTRTWSFYSSAWNDGSLACNDISDKTAKLSFDNSNKCTAYVDGSEIIGATTFVVNRLALGSSAGNSAIGIIVKGVKIYERGE